MRWSLYYDLWSKLALFAPKLRENKEVVDTSTTKQNGPYSLLDQMKDTFSYEDLKSERLSHGKSIEGTFNQLRQWKFRGYITQNEDGTYTKTEAKK